MHAAPPLQTWSAPQACTTAAWGLLALLQLPFSAVPVYIVYPIVHTCYNLVHIYACTSPCAPLRVHLISRAPHLVNLTSCLSRVYLYACTSTRAPHLACLISRAPHLVNLYACTAPREPHLVHIYACTSSRVHLYSCTSSRVHLSCIICTRAPINLMHQQAHPPSRWTWTIPLATVTFWPSALSISRS